MKDSSRSAADNERSHSKRVSWRWWCWH